MSELMERGLTIGMDHRRLLFCTFEKKICLGESTGVKQHVLKNFGRHYVTKT